MRFQQAQLAERYHLLSKKSPLCVSLQPTLPGSHMQVFCQEKNSKCFVEIRFPIDCDLTYLNQP